MKIMRPPQSILKHGMNDGDAREEDKGIAFKRTVRKASRKCVPPPESPSSILMKYFIDSEKQQKEKSHDPIDLFFESIAGIVKQFSPYYQNSCKSKIFSIVSELEMQQMLETSTVPTPPSSSISTPIPSPS
jgi:hypothetical protein